MYELILWVFISAVDVDINKIVMQVVSFTVELRDIKPINNVIDSVVGAC